MPLPSAEKEGLPAPLASSSLALLGSNPRNKKRQKHLFPCSCLLRRKRDCSLRSRARRWRSSVRTPATKKGKSTYSHALAFCGERGIARSARELVAGAPRFEPTQLKKAKALIPMLLPSAEKEGFEPPVRRKANNGFQDRRIRPLCHFSGGKSTAFFYSCKAKKGKSI